MANKSRVNIKTYNDNYITTNANEEISGKDVHDILEDIADSSLMQEDIVNDDTTGGITKPASAEIVKTHGTEIDNLRNTVTSNKNTIDTAITNLTNEVHRVENDLTDDINGIDNAVDANTANIQDILNKLVGLIIANGNNGRIRFDDAIKHWYFEVKQPDGTWLTKFEAGGSAYVDVVYFLETSEPPTSEIRQGSVAFFSKKTTSNGRTIERPEFKTSNGDLFSMVVHDEKTNAIVFRKSTGELIEIPVIYVHNGIEFSDINNIEYSGLVEVLKTNKKLRVNVLNNIDDAKRNDQNTYSSNKIESLIPTPSKIVSDINQELGNTTWQQGGGIIPSIGDIDGGNSATINTDTIDAGNSNN